MLERRAGDLLPPVPETIVRRKKSSRRPAFFPRPMYNQTKLAATTEQIVHLRRPNQNVAWPYGMAAWK